jgi:hypothetical protein
MTLEFHKSILIDPGLVQVLERFKNTEYCWVSCSRDKGSVRDEVIRLQKTLKGLKLGSVRVIGIGRVYEADESSKRVQVMAVVVINVLKGSGNTLAAFAQRMCELARPNGFPFMLHRLCAGPAELIEVATGKSLGDYGRIEEAIPEFFALAGGNRFELKLIDRLF